MKGLTGEPVDFVCECGCGEPVLMTVEDYDSAGGAWIEGNPAPNVFAASRAA